ncbi:MAG: phosphoglycerate kinase [Hyphomicrobiaceae bacterium]|nr:phosphoglycerate kinase [Hyphomicrobiaceae bacterium]
MTAFKTLDDLDLSGKRVLVRVDVNVPVADGKVTDTTRIERIVPTLNDIFAKGGQPVLLAHFGRPKGKVVPEMSLRIVVDDLARLSGRSVTFVETDWNDVTGAKTAIAAAPRANIIVLENTRFHDGEEKNDPDLIARMASLGDAYVNDAFSAAHRAHASTTGLAHVLPSAAGRLMEAELHALESGLGNPARPVIALVGGAKVSTKMDLLENLITKVDMLVIGGGMANTFLFAQGHDVGASLCEKDLADTALRVIAKAASGGCEIILPVDAVVAKEFKANAANRTVGLDQVASDDMILDVGPKSVDAIDAALAKAKTLVWNGPLGAFEIAPFDRGTVAAAQAAARLTKSGALVSVAGGGDTVAALAHAGVKDEFSYVSTAGGAFLEWMEGKVLPGVDALMH